MNTKKMDYLLQVDLKTFFNKNLQAENWTIVYRSFSDETHNGAFYSALVPTNQVSTVLSSHSWNLHIGDGRPEVWTYSDEGKHIVEYHPYTEVDKIQPIVLVREFNGIRNSCIEIQEEFRLFHNLFYDNLNSKYIKIHDDGNEEDIVVVGEDQVKIRNRALRQYAAIKGMSIVLQVNSVRYSPISLSTVSEQERHTEEQTKDFTYFVHVSNRNMAMSSLEKTFSRFLGKRIIAPLPLEKSGVWPYTNDSKQHESFIIDRDEDGDPVSYTSNPESLANFFGANPDAPNYLTSVFFRKEVLSKYYSQPEKYEVRDGHLFCGELWMLRMDNNLSNYVVVFLGDLGRDLPYSEQTYWKTFNIPPEGGVSNTCYTRSIEGCFADPEAPDLRFKYELACFKKEWQKEHSWPLFLELSEADQHLLTALHLPITNEQGEFDQQILALTKILVDSLNEREISIHLEEVPTGAKGIDKLEMFLKQDVNIDEGAIIVFLRDLQALRSSGVGHRKGSKFEKVAKKFDIGSKDLQSVCHSIFTDASVMLLKLKAYSRHENTSS